MGDTNQPTKCDSAVKLGGHLMQIRSYSSFVYVSREAKSEDRIHRRFFTTSTCCVNHEKF